MTEVVSTTKDGAVAVVEMNRPPANFFDRELLRQVADHVLELDGDPAVRAVVLCSHGRHFCAGADLRGMDADGIRSVYREALRLFTGRKPIVAAIQGAAIGGGLGLAMAADFRVAAADARLTANFARLGFHQGFGLSVTLPRAVGQQRALDLLYSGRNISGTEAGEIGLCDRVVPTDPRSAAIEWAGEIALSAPLSLVAIRSTMRRDVLAEAAAALDVEALAQAALLGTEDFTEGISASIKKRQADFRGH